MSNFTTQQTRQKRERILEGVRNMHIPEDKNVFTLNVQREEGYWYVSGSFDPFGHPILDGNPYPIPYELHLSDLKFPSREEALDFARKVHDVLVERGRNPEKTTVHFL